MKRIILSFTFVLTAVLLALTIHSCKPKEENVLVVCSFGGTFQEAQRKAFFEPFQNETGITIKEATYSGEASIIEAMVKSGKVEWDVVDVEHAVLLLGKSKGLYEPIDYTVVDSSALFPEAVDQHGVGADFYSTLIAYNEQNYPDPAKRPKGWSHFWDTKKYPGPRSLRNNPYTTLEFALLADGVQPDKLYPLDVDRAFASLDKLKKNVTVWWTQGQQPPQLLSDKEVVLSSAWSGRIWNARKQKQLPLSMVWQGGLLEPEWWVIPKGAKNKDLAMKFIEFASRAENQAKMAEYFGVGPTNKNSFAHLDKNLVAELPTYPENKAKQVSINGEWWAKNQDKVTERWNKWLLEK